METTVAQTAPSKENIKVGKVVGTDAGKVKKARLVKQHKRYTTVLKTKQNNANSTLCGIHTVHTTDCTMKTDLLRTAATIVSLDDDEGVTYEIGNFDMRVKSYVEFRQRQRGAITLVPKEMFLEAVNRLPSSCTTESSSDKADESDDSTIVL